MERKKIVASSRLSMVVTTTSAAASRSRCSTGASASAKASSRSCWSAQQPAVDLVQQIVLGAEVVVERALGDACRLDDLLHRGAVVAALGEEPGGGGQQPLGHGRAVPDRFRRLPACRLPPPALLVRRSWPVYALVAAAAAVARGNAVPAGGSSHLWSSAAPAGSPPRAGTCTPPAVPCSTRPVRPGSASAPGRRLTYALTVSPR